MSVGSRIRRSRLESRWTQRAAAKAAGLAPEYLSRVENGHVTPTSRTLVRIAGALNVPVAAFFGGTEPLEAGDRCPVSLSGRCILDHLFAGLGPHTKQGFEDYTAAQLESLRQCNYLLHEGSADVRRTLVTLLKSLVAHDETTRRSAKKTLAGD